MLRHQVWRLRLALVCFCFVVPTGFADTPPLVDLGDGRYQMGEILLDKPARWFSVPGRVIRDQPPLEYLAVKKTGHKAYESLFELDTTANEFNVACILIGLDADNAILPKHHFDVEPVQGDAVTVEIEWRLDGGEKIVPAETLFLVDGKPVESSGWVYTGSVILPDKRYLAEEVGTLIGFVHDQDSIIEHREGIGIGRFGEVKINQSAAPPLGTPIHVIVRNAAAR